MHALLLLLKTRIREARLLGFDKPILVFFTAVETHFGFRSVICRHFIKRKFIGNYNS